MLYESPKEKFKKRCTVVLFASGRLELYVTSLAGEVGLRAFCFVLFISLIVSCCELVYGGRKNTNVLKRIIYSYSKLHQIDITSF